MLDMIASILRSLFAAIGLLVLTDPSAAGTAAAVAALALVAVALISGAIVATGHAAGRGSPAHPTRHIELSAPLSQSDPDAAGHVRRRGPGRAATAA